MRSPVLAMVLVTIGSCVAPDSRFETCVVMNGGTELCNGVDDDCDGKIDDDPVDGQEWVTDADGDGWAKRANACERPDGVVTNAEREGDCHDDNKDAWPGSTATEVPLDGVDMDCDGNDFCTDLNCDGRPDVVLPSHHDGDYAVSQPARLISSTGGWGLESRQVAMSGTLGSAVADLNGDGYQDIIHASYHDGINHNAYSFIYWGPDHDPSTRVALPTSGAHWPCIGDLDGNGSSDIVFANHYDGDYVTESHIYWNRNGEFSASDRTALPTLGASNCTIEDLNSDSRPEIVFSNYYDGTSWTTNAFIYWGSESGYSAANRTVLPTVGNHTHTIVDVDGDSRKDLVFWSHRDGVAHATDHNYIYWNRTSGFTSADRTALPGMGGLRGAIADLNKDGRNDVIIPGYYAGNWQTVATTYIYWGNAANTYSTANRSALNLSGAIDALVDDLNQDGHWDILLAGQYDGDSFATSAVYWGTAGGTYNDANRTPLPGYHVIRGTSIVDFNHDGFKDVFLPGYHNNTTGADPMPWANQAFSRIYWGSASGPSTTYFDQWPSRGAWSAVTVGK